MSNDQHLEEKPVTKAEERNAFLFITVFFFPILSTILVGGYGLIVWISQIVLGPPGAG